MSMTVQCNRSCFKEHVEHGIELHGLEKYRTGLTGTNFVDLVLHGTVQSNVNARIQDSVNVMVLINSMNPSPEDRRQLYLFVNYLGTAVLNCCKGFATVNTLNL